MVLRSPFFKQNLAGVSVNDKVHTMLRSMVEAVTEGVALLENGMQDVRSWTSG